MNLLSFNKTNPNLTVIPFKENKCTSSETQTCEEGRKKKEKESYLDVKKEETKKKGRREKTYLDVKKEESKRKKRKRKKSYLDRCEEGRKKKERKKNLKNEE